MKLSATEVKIKLLKLSKKNFSAWRKLRTIFRKAFYANIHHFHFPLFGLFHPKNKKIPLFLSQAFPQQRDDKLWLGDGNNIWR